MESEHEKETGVEINILKDELENGPKLYRYSYKTGKEVGFGGLYFNNDLAEELSKFLLDVPFNAQVTLSSAHRLMADTHTHEKFLTDEELEALATALSKYRNDLRYVLKPAGISYYKEGDKWVIVSKDGKPYIQMTTQTASSTPVSSDSSNRPCGIHNLRLAGQH